MVGSDSATADFEILSLMKYALSVIGVENVIIKVKHRGSLNEFFETIGLREKSEDILRTIDKLAKIGEEKVKAEDAEKNVITLKNLLTREQFTDISVEDAGKIILGSKN